MQYLQEFAISPVATAVLLVVLIPLIEEPLFRGAWSSAVGGTAVRVAYVVSVLVYALACVWRYALEIGDPAYLLLFIQYLPMSLALTWCYDNGGSIWSAVALHMTINGFMLFSIVRCGGGTMPPTADALS